MKLKKYTLKNSQRMSIDVINYGGIVTSIMVPDKNGKLGDVVLGFDDLCHFQKSNPSYYGAVIGRYANRIAGGHFTLDGESYHLAVNDGPNALHGGKVGFDKVFWNVEEGKNSLQLSYDSQDMEEGYPGHLKTEVIYSINDRNEFTIHYTAVADKPTPVSLTHHAYFNLTGTPGTTILDHELMISADRYTVTDSTCIPTGELRLLERPLDFRKPRAVGEQILKVHEGYNHNYVLNKPGLSEIVATLRDPQSGRFMEVLTTEPGLQLYTGYFLEQKLLGKNNTVYPRYGGLCLEAQHFPNSPNQLDFPSTILRPGDTYRQTTTYRFGVRP